MHGNGYFGTKSRVCENEANRHPTHTHTHTNTRCLGQKCDTQVTVNERAEDKEINRHTNYFPRNRQTYNWHEHVVWLSLKFVETCAMCRRCKMNKCIHTNDE